MGNLKTLTEYQLLYLARGELLRRLDRLQIKIAKFGEDNLSRRDKALYNLYSEQATEINERMAEINGDN